MLRLFSSLQRAHFQVYCYAAGPDDGSSERATVAGDCDVFTDVSLLGPTDTAALVGGDRLSLTRPCGHLKVWCRAVVIRLRGTECTRCWTMTACTSSIRWGR